MVWETKKLGDLFKIGSSKRVLKSEWKDSGVPFFRGREITTLSKNGNVDNALFISEEHFARLSSKYGMPHKDDILITAIGTIGNTYIVKESDRFYFKDASVLWLRGGSDVDSNFIDYWFKSSSFFEQLDVGNGATVDTLNISKLSNMDIQLPPLPEQKRIVAKLDKAFAGIEKAVEATELNKLGIKKLTGSFFQKIFLKNEKKENLGALCSLIARGISPKYIEHDGVRVINQKCIRHHEIDYSLSRKHDYEQKIVKEERFIKKGDVLVNSTGVGTLGRVAQVRQQPKERTTVDSHVTIIRPHEGLFFLDFFGYALIMIENQLQDAGQGLGGQTELAKSKVSNDFHISYPSSFKEQEEIVKTLDELSLLTSSYEDNLIEKRLQLNHLKSAILKKELQSEAA